MIGFPKPPSRRKVKDKAKRLQRKDTAAIRQYVFARERDVCRCCRRRKADSMHEMVSRGRRGKRSKVNSIAVCGDGVNGCHGFLQRYEIRVNSVGQPMNEPERLNAEQTLMFTPYSAQAREWMHLESKDSLLALISEPMQQIESAE